MGDCVSLHESPAIILMQLCESKVLIIVKQSLVLYGQATKRIRRMPWRSEAMKDVAACEKRRGVGNKH